MASAAICSGVRGTVALWSLVTTAPVNATLIIIELGPDRGYGAQARPDMAGIGQFCRNVPGSPASAEGYSRPGHAGPRLHRCDRRAPGCHGERTPRAPGVRGALP